MQQTKREALKLCRRRWWAEVQPVKPCCGLKVRGLNVGTTVCEGFTSWWSTQVLSNHTTCRQEGTLPPGELVPEWRIEIINALCSDKQRWVKSPEVFSCLTFSRVVAVSVGNLTVGFWNISGEEDPQNVSTFRRSGQKDPELKTRDGEGTHGGHTTELCSYEAPAWWRWACWCVRPVFIWDLNRSEPQCVSAETSYSWADPPDPQSFSWTQLYVGTTNTKIIIKVLNQSLTHTGSLHSPGLQFSSWSNNSISRRNNLTHVDLIKLLEPVQMDEPGTGGTSGVSGPRAVGL